MSQLRNKLWYIIINQIWDLIQISFFPYCPFSTQGFHIRFNNHISFNFYWSVTVSPFMLTFLHNRDNFEEYLSGVLQYVQQFGSVWCFLQGLTEVMCLKEEEHRGELLFSSYHIKDTCYHHVFSLMMLALITW